MGHGEGGDKVWMAYIKSKDAVAWEAFKNGSENVFVLVLAHLEPELELFEVDDIGDDGDVICSTIISQTSNSSSSGFR